MKVVQVVPSIGAEASGPSYSVPGLCRGLLKNQVDVELHFLDEIPRHLVRDAYPVVNYPRHDRLGMGVSPEMMRGLLASARSADIVQNNGLWMMPNVYSFRVVRKLRREDGCCGRPKLVMSPRGTLAAWALRRSFWKKKLFGYFAGQYAALRAADMFHATSEKEYEEIRALGYKQPIAIVPIGMEIPEVGQVSPSVMPCQGGWGTPGMKKVVFFGRLHKVKAVDRLVRAWERLNQPVAAKLGDARSFTDWELLIAGPDNGIRGELEAYIADHKIPRVTFVGEINGPTKYEFLSQADLYVLPSFSENFGITVAEALACGTPVIVSKGTPWQGVVDHQCGWWVENSPDSLVVALHEAISLSRLLNTSTSQLALMGERGREWIRRDFSWEGVGARMKAAYEWLLLGRESALPDWVKIV